METIPVIYAFHWHLLTDWLEFHIWHYPEVILVYRTGAGSGIVLLGVMLAGVAVMGGSSHGWRVIIRSVRHLRTAWSSLATLLLRRFAGLVALYPLVHCVAQVGN